MRAVEGLAGRSVEALNIPHTLHDELKLKVIGKKLEKRLGIREKAKQKERETLCYLGNTWPLMDLFSSKWGHVSGGDWRGLCLREKGGHILRLSPALGSCFRGVNWMIF